MAQVKVYSTPGCTNCILLKNFLKENKIAFDEVNVAADRLAAKEMVQKTGQMTVPVTEINGKFILGRDTQAIMNEINTAK